MTQCSVELFMSFLQDAKYSSDTSAQGYPVFDKHYPRQDVTVMCLKACEPEVGRASICMQAST